MVTNVTLLLKTVKAVEDEATKGTRGLEATIEHIKQELAVSPLVTSFIPFIKGALKTKLSGFNRLKVLYGQHSNQTKSFKGYVIKMF